LWNNVVEPTRRVESPRRIISFPLSRPSLGGRGADMEVVYRRCCGIDVHKDSITACVPVNAAGKA
jgi:hypothetical protein